MGWDKDHTRHFATFRAQNVVFVCQYVDKHVDRQAQIAPKTLCANNVTAWTSTSL